MAQPAVNKRKYYSMRCWSVDGINRYLTTVGFLLESRVEVVKLEHECIVCMPTLRGNELNRTRYLRAVNLK